MLNISNNKIDRERLEKTYSVFKMVETKKYNRSIVQILLAGLVLFIVVLFLPWTQNIQVKGYITTLQPDHREQTIHSMISGRVDEWYVREGQLVKSGDTILHISEIKSDYLDPELVSNTGRQRDAKSEAVGAYQEKIKALESQRDNLIQNQVLKLRQIGNKIKQARLKLRSDSMSLETERINIKIAEQRLKRQQKLYDQGLKSLTDLESKKLKFQETKNKLIYYENQYLVAQNDLINAQIGQNATRNEYQEKIAKSISDIQSAKGALYNAEADLSKLNIKLASYTKRNSFYHITAPQNGYVTRALKVGIGETVKEGEAIFTFIPEKYRLAAEIFVEPLDLPLIHEGNHVRLQFDGWPAVVFSGWPNLSLNTYGGTIVAYDRATRTNGKFRVLIAPDEDTPWPPLLRLGTGVRGVALFKKVHVGYELWRELNGFPPDFYFDENGNTKLVKDVTKKKK